MDAALAELEPGNELRKLAIEALAKPEDYGPWEALVSAAEHLEGGLNRNSSPQAIAAYRAIFDRFLLQFPLFFGYWKKYADHEFNIAGTEAAEMVFERGIASVTASVDLWAAYCTFKFETCHEPDIIRELFERAADAVGLDFLGHAFWDKYLEFEERVGNRNTLFAVLKRLIYIPQHQYSRYFDQFRVAAANQPIEALASTETITGIRQEVSSAFEDGRQISGLELDREIRNRVDTIYLELNAKTQQETMKRWTYEQNIKRPYFHVTELEEDQLENWRKYLDFEEAEGDKTRIIFLYERCLVSCAYYVEFWLRYARYVHIMGKAEDVRIIYLKAASIYAPVSQPQIRLNYALFEEQDGRTGTAREIYDAVLLGRPGDVDAIVAKADFERRCVGLSAAVDLYFKSIYSEDSECTLQSKAVLLAHWARLLCAYKRRPEEARQLFVAESSTSNFKGVREFWESYLRFEMDASSRADFPVSSASELSREEEAKNQESRVRGVWKQIQETAILDASVVRDLYPLYKMFLLKHGTYAAGAEAREALALDAILFGPESVRKALYLAAQ